MAFQHSSLAPYPPKAYKSRREAALDSQKGYATAGQQAFREPEEWILFPTRTRSSLTQDSFTECTEKTTNFSQLSNINSTPAALRSQIEIPVSGSEAIEDDELDVLDDSLHAFYDATLYIEPKYLDQAHSVLPTHDGLGAFHPSIQPMQEQLRRFENPAAARTYGAGSYRRRPSVQRRLDLAEVYGENLQEDARNERIEQWRLEHSRVLLDEIEKETRRRMSYSPHHTNRVQKRRIADGSSPRRANAAVGDRVAPQFLGGNWWQKLTRRFIQSVVGIDDELLAVIFGEALPKSEKVHDESIKVGSRGNQQISLLDRKGWEQRLIDRLTREMEIFNPKLYGHQNSGTVSPIAEEASEEDSYAGLPLPINPASHIAKTADEETMSHTTQPLLPSSDLPSLAFKPTLQRQQHRPLSSDSIHAASWGIEEDTTPNDRLLHEESRRDREYWEGTPTVSTIFHYIRTRFIASRNTSSASNARQPQQQQQPSKSTDHQQAQFPSAASLRRATLIRQLHPLIAMQTKTSSRRQSSSSLASQQRPPSSILLHRQSSLLRRPMLSSAHSGSSIYVYHDQVLRSQGSCRSESSSVLGRRRWDMIRSASSRNYWDVATSSVGGDEVSAGGGGWGAV